MIPPSFDYEAPTSVEEAIAILGKNPDAKILAGGQSLIALMKLRLASPAVLVDINKIEALDPVCGMTVDIATSSLITTHEGHTYHFCSAGCKHRFEQHPETYLVKG